VPAETPLPEGEIAKRPLQFFWVVDSSGSMDGAKIATVNHAIREATQRDLPGAVENHPEVQIMMRGIKFSDSASWHVGPDAVPLDKFLWPELTAGGSTATAQAMRLLTTELNTEKMPRRGFPPVCILLSDGYCTDPESDYQSAIEALDRLPWGAKAVRLAIGIGGDKSQYDEESLGKFISPGLRKEGIGVLQASNAEQLVHYIKWASVSASVASSMTKSKSGQADGANVLLDPPPPAPQVTGETDVF